MGGAVAYNVYNIDPQFWSGVVFMAPMCKISICPPQWIIDTIMFIIGDSGTDSFLGSLAIAPSKGDVGQLAMKLESKLHYSRLNPLRFENKPRLATARELLVCLLKFLITNFVHIIEFDVTPLIFQFVLILLVSMLQ